MSPNLHKCKNVLFLANFEKHWRHQSLVNDPQGSAKSHQFHALTGQAFYLLKHLRRFSLIMTFLMPRNIWGFETDLKNYNCKKMSRQRKDF